MANERLSSILVALALLQFQVACRSEGAATPTHPVARASAAPAPAPGASPDEAGAEAPEDVPAPIATLRDLLADAGLSPSRIVRLGSRQELPGCPAAELRYRFYMGDLGAFFNASWYRSGADAQVCRNDFQAMALKGGASAWERLQQDVFVQGSWLILFPPEQPSKEVRERILRAIGRAPTP